MRSRGGVCVFTCGWCGQPGHTRKICPKARVVRKADHGGSNADYRANRARKLCDDCGAPSPKTFCPRCSKRKRDRRLGEPKGDRALDYLKRNAARNAARGVTLDRDVDLYRIAKQEARTSDAYEQEIAAHVAWMQRQTGRKEITRVNALRSLLELGLAHAKKLRAKKGNRP